MYTKNKINIEYPIQVDKHLKGILDYYIAGTNNLLVIEAKQSDLERGFTQLSVELIALSIWLKSNNLIVYGAVSTGDDWKFGIYDSSLKKIKEDITIYRVPENLDILLNNLIGILSQQL